MKTYWVSFTIADEKVDGEDYNARWEALYDAVYGMNKGVCWEETTAFILFQTDIKIDDVMRKLKAAVSPEHDIVLVRYLDHANARFFGPVVDVEALKKLIPYIERA